MSELPLKPKNTRAATRSGVRTRAAATKNAAGAARPRTEAAAPPPPPAGAGAFQLGERVRRLRAARGLTLEEVAGRAGLARSTLSKIENDHTSPTFEVLLKLAHGLGLALDELLTAPRVNAPSGRRSITRKDEGQRQDTGLYSHEFLCTDLTSKNIVPSKARIHSRSLADFSGWVRHEGEDFLLVLEGAIELHTEFYAPVRMEAGDSAYFDARMGHLCISVSDEDALVLWVPTHGDEAAAVDRQPVFAKQRNGAPRN